MNLLFSFTDKWLSLPIWAWIVIAAVVLILIIVIAVVAAKAARAKKQSAASEELPEPAAPAEEEESSLDEEYVPEEKPAVAQSSAEPVPAEPVKAAPASAESSSAPAEEEKPVAKVRTEFVRKTPVQPKPVQQSQPVQQTQPEAQPAQTAAQADAAKLGGIKVYHITKRKLDGKWQIKFNNGKKAIKLFDTQLQAIEYAKALAINQEASIMIHKEDGTFRKLRYDKPNK